MYKSFSIIALLVLSCNCAFSQLNRFKQDAWYCIIATQSNKALEVTGNDNGAFLHQNDSTGADNQLFQFRKVSGGYFQIVVKSSGKSLGVKDGSVKDHAPIEQNEFTGQDNQLFCFIQNGYGASAIAAKNSGYGFDVLGGPKSLANNAQVIQYPTSGATNQFFRIVEIPATKKQ